MTLSGLVLAPFKGITEKVFRNAHARHIGGLDAVFAPYISGWGEGRVHPAKLGDVLPMHTQLYPTIPQFVSINPKEIILLGNTLKDNGYELMNWNLGCPFQRIADKKRGCGILPYPDDLNKILDEAMGKLSIGLSIKMRLGYYQKEEIKAIIPILNQYPLHHIVLHPRTGLQRYSGYADPHAYKEVSGISLHRVIYNGDLFTADQFKQMQRLFPQSDTWMLGRGLLMNPFLAMDIKQNSPEESQKKERLEAFCQEMILEMQGSGIGELKTLGAMKAVWFYLSGLFAEADKAYGLVKRTRTLRELDALMSEILEESFADQHQMQAYADRHFRKNI